MVADEAKNQRSLSLSMKFRFYSPCAESPLEGDKIFANHIPDKRLRKAKELLELKNKKWAKDLHSISPQIDK